MYQFDGEGRLRFGGATRRSKAWIVADLPGSNADGIFADVAASKDGVSERAGNQLGDYFIGQDTRKDGTKDYGIVDVNGNVLVSLSSSRALEYGATRAPVAANAPADTNENIVATVSLAANALGPNGRLYLLAQFGTITNNANAKTARIRIGGIGGTILMTQNLASSAGGMLEFWIYNRNSAASQYGFGAGTFNGLGAIPLGWTAAAVNTALSTTVVLTLQKATAGDTITTDVFDSGIFPSF